MFVFACVLRPMGRDSSRSRSPHRPGMLSWKNLSCMSRKLWDFMGWGGPLGAALRVCSRRAPPIPPPRPVQEWQCRVWLLLAFAVAACVAFVAGCGGRLWSVFVIWPPGASGCLSFLCLGSAPSVLLLFVLAAAVVFCPLMLVAAVGVPLLVPCGFCPPWGVFLLVVVSGVCYLVLWASWGFCSPWGVCLLLWVAVVCGRCLSFGALGLCPCWNVYFVFCLLVLPFCCASLLLGGCGWHLSFVAGRWLVFLLWCPVASARAGVCLVWRLGSVFVDWCSGACARLGLSASFGGCDWRLFYRSLSVDLPVEVCSRAAATAVSRHNNNNQESCACQWVPQFFASKCSAFPNHTSPAQVVIPVFHHRCLGRSESVSNSYCRTSGLRTYCFECLAEGWWLWHRQLFESWLPAAVRWMAGNLLWVAWSGIWLGQTPIWPGQAPGCLNFILSGSMRYGCWPRMFCWRLLKCSYRRGMCFFLTFLAKPFHLMKM